jgi:DNA gyrase/topoisomerase IV subunit A
LAEIKKIVGKDERLTEISYSKPVETSSKPLVKQEYKVYSNGLHFAATDSIETNIVDVVYAYSPADIYVYNKDGIITNVENELVDIVGATTYDAKKTKLVAVTKNGNIKVSMLSDYKLDRKEEKVLKLKEDDELIYAGFCTDTDSIMLFNGENKVLKLAIADLPVASKLTLGVKSGFSVCAAATVVSEGDLLLLVTSDLKGKYTPVKDFSIDNRGNKGQTICDNTIFMRRIDPSRENLYVIPKTGKPFVVARNKLSIKSRTAAGALVSTRNITMIV